MTTDRRVRRRAHTAAERERQQQRRSEIERLAAVRAEEIAEEQAPRQQRVAVLAADGTVVREALAELARHGGYRRANALMRMHAGNSRLVTRQHLQAADRFGRDYEIGILGASPPRGTLTRVDGSAAPDVPQARLDALARYRDTCDALGRSLRQPVQWVALHGWSLGRVARMLAITEAAASGYLVAGLDALADHYWPDRRGRAPADELVVVDAGVVDIPQERLGRQCPNLNLLDSAPNRSRIARRHHA